MRPSLEFLGLADSPRRDWDSRTGNHAGQIGLYTT